MAGEAGADTWAAMSNAVHAEALAESMVGLEETFSDMMDELASITWHAGPGYADFRSNLLPEIRTVQSNGLQLANSIQAGASEIAKNDYESSEGYTEAWGNIPEVNGAFE